MLQLFTNNRLKLRPRSKLILALGVAAIFTNNLFINTQLSANPSGANIIAGDVKLETKGKTLEINQSSNKAIIDWRDFDIKSDEHTKFSQPSSKAIILNRIKDVKPSNISGKLSANGNVILINPNGLFFGANSQIDVNSLIATTANIKNQDFLNGDLNFNQPGNIDAAIINEGLISAKDAGLVGLVAPTVINRGIIKANLGKVQLASADMATIDLYGDGLTFIAISDEVKEQLIENNGLIETRGGEIYITAAAGRDIIDSLINIKGELIAPTIEQKEGKIIIKSSNKDNFINVENALIDTSAINTGDGGDIEIRSENINVSGETKIKANANNIGDGGEVMIFAENRTNFTGLIESKGGDNGGDGGFIETSGKVKLVIGEDTLIDRSARIGNSGLWLLDPQDFFIGGANADIEVTTLQTNLAGGDVTILLPYIRNTTFLIILKACFVYNWKQFFPSWKMLLKGL